MYLLLIGKILFTFKYAATFGLYKFSFPLVSKPHFISVLQTALKVQFSMMFHKVEASIRTSDSCLSN